MGQLSGKSDGPQGWYITGLQGWYITGLQGGYITGLVVSSQKLKDCARLIQNAPHYFPLPRTFKAHTAF